MFLFVQGKTLYHDFHFKTKDNPFDVQIEKRELYGMRQSLHSANQRIDFFVFSGIKASNAFVGRPSFPQQLKAYPLQR